MDSSTLRDRFWVGTVQVSPQHNTLQAGENKQSVQPRAMAVLQYLARHSERVISADELLENVWHNRVVTQASVQKSINTLRTAFGALGLDEDYIVHYSKRGYQLVQPVRAEQAALSGARPVDKRRQPRKTGLFLGLTLGVIVALGWLVHQWRTPSLDNPPPLPGLSYRDFESATVDEGRAVTGEPQPATSRLAFVRSWEGLNREEDGSGDDIELIIQASKDSEWRVSGARNPFIDLAWSPSGRNLAALERLNVEARRAALAPEGVSYFNIHIYTFDFKSERVIEKNLLSHWQGDVVSLAWWDDKELEFVARQGDHAQLERYRYRVPDQTLIRLARVKAHQMPLKSEIKNQQTVLLSQADNGFSLTWLDQRQLPVRQWSLGYQPRGLAWLEDGSAFGVLAESGTEVTFYYPSGALTAAKVMVPEQGRLEDIHFREDFSMLATVSYPTMELFWQQAEGGPQLLIKTAGSAVAALHPRRPEVMLARTVEGEHQLLTATAGGDHKLHALALDHPVVDILWAENASEVFIHAGDEIWTYDYANSQARVVLTVNGDLKVLAVDRPSKSVWLLMAEGGVKNIWRYSVKGTTVPPKQFSFADVAAAVAHRGGIYFQYSALDGLWRLDQTSGETQLVVERLPENSRVLQAKENRLTLVSGVPCEEKALHFLDLSTYELAPTVIPLNPGYNTVAMNANGDLLRSKCSKSPSRILTFKPSFPD